MSRKYSVVSQATIAQDGQGTPLPDEGVWAVFNQVALSRLASQSSQADALESKVTAILGFGSAIVPIALAFLALRPQPLDVWAWGPLSLGLLAYAYLLVTSLRVLFPKVWDAGPDLEDMWLQLTEEDARSLSYLVGYALEEACALNRPRLQSKSAAVKRLTMALAVEAVSIAASALLAILSWGI